MKVEKGQVIEFLQDVKLNKVYPKGSKWIVTMASDGKGCNALTVKTSKTGKPLSDNNLNNLGSLTESEAEKLTAAGMIEIK